MKIRLHVTIVALLAVVLLMPLSLRAQSQPKPEMTFATMSHDFGDFGVNGEPKTFLFEFTNTGNAPLVVVRTSTSCKCISVKIPRRPVQPQGKGVVEVTYKPSSETGAFNKGIRIFSNVEGGQLTLFVKGVVLEDK